MKHEKTMSVNTSYIRSHPDGIKYSHTFGSNFASEQLIQWDRIGATLQSEESKNSRSTIKALESSREYCIAAETVFFCLLVLAGVVPLNTDNQSVIAIQSILHDSILDPRTWLGATAFASLTSGIFQVAINHFEK